MTRPGEPTALSSKPERLLGPALLLLGILACAHAASRPADPLAADLARWKAWVADTSSKDELKVEGRQSAGPLLTRAEKALADGRRSLALFRLGAARAELVGVDWATSRPKAEREELPAFEAVWRQQGKSLGRAPNVEGALPALIRGMAESAALKSQGYYDGSRDYGVSTAPVYGLYYLGMAQGQSELAKWLATLPDLGKGRSLTIRSPGPEIDRLQHRLLEAYRPPQSIDRHPDFIRASAALKEARELDAAGLRHGALLQTLYAGMLAAPLLQAPPVDTAQLESRLADDEMRLKDGRDHGIATLFLEIAREDLQTGAAPVRAASIVAEVMPLYFAALGPATKVAASPPAKVTVTLVRWPYT